MKIIIIIFVLILLVFFAYKFFGKPNNSVTSIGKVENIEYNIENLMQSTNEYAYLIIKIQGSEDFIQFTGDAKGVQLDLPLITKRQEELETAFWHVGKELDLKVVENKGSDGSRFLDIDLNGNSFEISKIVKLFMEKLFNVKSSTKLVFEYDI